MVHRLAVRHLLQRRGDLRRVGPRGGCSPPLQVLSRGRGGCLARDPPRGLHLPDPVSPPGGRLHVTGGCIQAEEHPPPPLPPHPTAGKLQPLRDFPSRGGILRGDPGRTGKGVSAAPGAGPSATIMRKPRRDLPGTPPPPLSLLLPSQAAPLPLPPRDTGGRAALPEASNAAKARRSPRRRRPAMSRRGCSSAAGMAACLPPGRAGAERAGAGARSCHRPPASPHPSGTGEGGASEMKRRSPGNRRLPRRAAPCSARG